MKECGVNGAMGGISGVRACPVQESGGRRGRWLPGLSVAGTIMLLWTACAAPLRAEDSQGLEVAVVESRGGEYTVPAGRTVEFVGQSLRLFIRIRNTPIPSN
jgi:hypothetical protein